jgi:hypothetical protein
MNSAHTYETIRSKYTQQLTSPSFHPDSAIWINCTSYTYYPHSNEYRPRAILAFTVMSICPNPSTSILLPFMDANIAQLSCWWIAKSLVTASVDLPPIIDSFSIECDLPPILLRHDSFPSDIAILPQPHDQIDNSNTHSLSDLTRSPVEEDLHLLSPLSSSQQLHTNTLDFRHSTNQNKSDATSSHYNLDNGSPLT